MGNQLKIVATINPANTAVEVSTDNGATYRAVAMSTVGSQQEGLLTGVPAATYAANTIKIRAVAFPAVGASEPLARTVVAATTLAMGTLTGQSNNIGTGHISDYLASAALSALSPSMLRTFSSIRINYLGTSPDTSTGTMQALQVPSSEALPVLGNNMAAWDSAYVANTTYPACYGLEAPMAYLYAREQSGLRLDLFKRSANGAPISAWQGPSGVTAKAIADFNAQKALLPSSMAYDPKFFVWVQGESNSTDAVATYQSALQAELDRFRAAGMITATTKVVLVGIKPGGNTDTAKQNIAAADTSGKTVFVSTMDAAVYGDGVHYTGLGNITIGERAYNAINGTSVTIVPPPPATPRISGARTTQIADPALDITQAPNPIFRPSGGMQLDKSAVYSTIGGIAGYFFDLPASTIEFTVENAATVTIKGLESTIGGEVELLCNNVLIAAATTLVGTANAPRTIFNQIPLPAGVNILLYRHKATGYGRVLTLAQVVTT